VPAPRRNVELKAHDRDPARSLERALALGAADHGELRRRDTYLDARRWRFGELLPHGFDRESLG
jgi:adenylate cyclase class IV